MDERVVEDVMPVSEPHEPQEPQEPQDVISQGKRSRSSVLEQQVRVIPREGAQPRSSIQEFVDIFHGRDPNNTVNIVGTSSNHGGNSGGSVEELTLGHYDTRRSMLNENEMMETLLDERKRENHPGDGIEPGSSHRCATSHEGFPTTSVVLENLKATDILARQSSDQNSNLLGQSSYNSNGIVLGNELSSGGMRTKILSKSSGSGFSEYFFKSTLKGKGIIYQRGLTGTDADAGSGTAAGAGAGAGIDAGAVFHAGTKIRGQNSVEDSVSHTTTCDQLVNVREKYMVRSANNMVGFNLGTRGESVSNGVSLREFLESGKGNLLKVDCMFVFKQILDLVCSLHSQGKILVDLRPSCFKLLPSKKVVFCGRISISTEVKKLKQNEAQKLQAVKRPSEPGRSRNCVGGTKHLKLSDNMNFHPMTSRFQLGSRLKPITINDGANLASPGLDCSSLSDSNPQGISSSFPPLTSIRQHAFSSVDQSEAKWYRSPEEVSGSTCSYSSNVYCLGVFLFELLSSFQSAEARDAAMSDLHLRILPPNFLSENPMEAGFCLWLLHPKPSLRPKARDILHSEIVSGYRASCADDKSSSTLREDEDVTELLLQFLLSIKEQKEKHASKLVADLEYIQADIQEMEERHLLRKNPGRVCSQDELQYVTERGFLHSGDGLFDPAFHRRDSRFFKNVSQIGNAYFSARSQAQARGSDFLIRPDSDVLKTRENRYSDQQVDEKPVGSIEELFDGLCKYARYSKLEVCGKIRNRDISCSNNVICSLSFDRDEDYFVAAGVSKKIRIFDFHAVCDSSIDVHYPMVEMSNKSKLSSVCWNKYIRNYMASTDYDGVVKLWDASTGEEFLEYKEHLRRAWCVDFSNLDPKKLASGSDDCSVKLWSINERNCVHNIRNVANVCSVQFSAHSSHLLAFGSADYKIFCYDLRNTASPWCILSGHEKSVSYVKFVDSDTIVSASTDNTLKLWDLSRSTDDGLSHNACKLTLSGHTNEKNFVGMSVSNGFIACGSETNEVFTYYKTMPVPITSLKFGTIDSVTGEETDYNHGQFVSSVCWKENSEMLVAANSGGCIKVLRMA